MRVALLNPSSAYGKSFIGRLNCIPRRSQKLEIEPESSDPILNLLLIVSDMFSVLGLGFFVIVLEHKSLDPRLS